VIRISADEFDLLHAIRCRAAQLIQVSGMCPASRPLDDTAHDPLSMAVGGTAVEHDRQIARPFDWTFTRADLERVLAKITKREPRLALAA
jgi:hypothetical protein